MRETTIDNTTEKLSYSVGLSNSIQTASSVHVRVIVCAPMMHVGCIRPEATPPTLSFDAPPSRLNFMSHSLKMADVVRTLTCRTLCPPRPSNLVTSGCKTSLSVSAREFRLCRGRTSSVRRGSPRRRNSLGPALLDPLPPRNRYSLPRRRDILVNEVSLVPFLFVVYRSRSLHAETSYWFSTLSRAVALPPPPCNSSHPISISLSISSLLFLSFPPPLSSYLYSYRTALTPHRLACWMKRS